MRRRRTTTTEAAAADTHRAIEEAGKGQDHPIPRLVVRPSVGPENVLLLEGHNKLASEIINPNALLSVCLSRPKKGHSV